MPNPIQFWRQDTFYKDIIVLILGTILVGGALSFGLAWTVDRYFGDTVTGLIGDAGQYDLILHIREDAKEAALIELDRIIQENFPGAKYVAAPTLAGKANYLLSLPEESKSRKVLENIDSYFNTLPGWNGSTFIIAPAVTVRGVQFGAKGILISRLEELDGVKFAFINGGNVLAVLKDAAQAKTVSHQVKAILDEYRTIEVRFPLGYQVDDLSQTGSQIVLAIQDQLRPKLVKDVTLSSETTDLNAFMETLVEMKRFLLGYASQVEIALESTAALKVGESVILQGASPHLLVVGDGVRPDNLIIDILEIQGDVARGIITQGDISAVDPEVQSLAAYRLERGTDVGVLVGKTTIYNQRYQLLLAIDESVKLLQELEVMAEEADQTGQDLLVTLDAYEQTLDQIARVEETLRQVNQSLDGPLNQLNQIDIEDVVAALQTTSTSIDYLLSTLGVVNPPTGQMADVGQVPGGLGDIQDQVVQGTQDLETVVKNINPVAQLLRKFQERIQTFTVQVNNFGSLAENSNLVHNLLGDIGGATSSALNAMEAVDVNALRSHIHEITERLRAIGDLDTDLVREEMNEVRTTLPNLTDEEIGRSIRLIDSYIGGEVIPGERVQLLVDASVQQKEVIPILNKLLGSQDFSVLEMPVGILEPDVRGLVFSVLREVRSTIAGLVAIVFTLIVLWLDHALLINALRCLVPGRLGRLRHLRLGERFIPDLAGIYGAVVGGVILWGSYTLGGGAIPWLSPLHILALGVLLGLGTGALAQRISPVSEAELNAGLSLGLRKTDILREIVIPEGRPGLANWLNRRNLRFMAGGGN